MKPRPLHLAVLGLVLVAFTAFSTVVSLEHGYWGFLDVPAAGGWGLQVFGDLIIALLLLSRHMAGAAKEAGVPVWPYLLSLPFLGSIGALVFYLHVELKRGRS